MFIKKETRGLAAILSCALLLGTLGACAGQKNASQQDILTQKVTTGNRTQVTVLVKYAFGINRFEQVVEEKFPDIDIVQVGNYTRDMGKAEYVARLEHDDLTDIVMTWPLDVGQTYWSDRLLDLSGMSFTSNYNLSMLDTISRDGKLYYLPGPAQVRGIVYNKTLFAEHGWKVPQNYEEFKTLCQTIEQAGIRSIQLGFQNGEVLDTAFMGYGYSACFAKPSDNQFLDDYNKGKGSFGDHYRPALDTFQDMIDAGIWKPEDLNVDYAARETMFFNRQCAMIEDSVLMARMGYEATGITDEFGIMPFFNPGTDSDWARLYMVCYIGLNKHLAEPENKKKLNLVMKLMEFISTPEGQEALAGDTGAMFSSLTNMPPPNIPEIEDLQVSLKYGRYSVFPELKNAQTALRQGLAGMVRGDTTQEQLIQMVDKQNMNPKASVPPDVLGQASANFNLVETGHFITDAMRNESGCEIALFMDNGKDGRYNGKGVSGSIYQGDVTTMDILRILPDLKHGEDGTLWKVTMTGRDLRNTLEYAIAVDNGANGWFYYFSGLTMTYAPAAEPGTRIHAIKTIDGKEIDPDKTYTIAVMDQTVPEEFLLSCEKTGVKIEQILHDAVRKAGTISPSGDRRFTVALP